MTEAKMMERCGEIKEPKQKKKEAMTAQERTSRRTENDC